MHTDQKFKGIFFRLDSIYLLQHFLVSPALQHRIPLRKDVRFSSNTVELLVPLLFFSSRFLPAEH